MQNITTAGQTTNSSVRQIIYLIRAFTAIFCSTVCYCGCHGTSPVFVDAWNIEHCRFTTVRAPDMVLIHWRDGVVTINVLKSDACDIAEGGQRIFLDRVMDTAVDTGLRCGSPTLRLCTFFFIQREQKDSPLLTQLPPGQPFMTVHAILFLQRRQPLCLLPHRTVVSRKKLGHRWGVR